MSELENLVSGEEDENAEKPRLRNALVCGCSCFALFLLVSIIVGMIAGYSYTKVCLEPFTGVDALLHAVGFVCKDGQIMPQISKCDDYFCAEGDGPLYTPENVTGSLELWVPECTSDMLLSEFEAYSKQSPMQLVTFTSRPGKEGQPTVTLSGWWLPAKTDGSTAPRIIVQHGNNVDFNDNTVMLPGYLLRTIGFSVLLPNHRYHGTPIHDPVEQTIRWGYDLFLDTLGAWDYAVADPDGRLGGPMPPDRVGIMGLSMGGLAASTAFGYEPRIPAAWIDAGVFDIQAELDYNVDVALPLGPVLFLAKHIAWQYAKWFTGVDIALYTPARTLPRGGELSGRKRKAAVVQGSLDVLVPPWQSEMLVSLFEKHSDHYSLEKNIFVAYSCGGERYPFPTHVHMHTWRPSFYRRELCEFWTNVFELPTSSCGLDDVPAFPDCEEAVCPVPPAST